MTTLRFVTYLQTDTIPAKETHHDMHLESPALTMKGRIPHTESKVSGMLRRMQLLVVAMVLGSNGLKAEEAPVLNSSVMAVIEKDDDALLSQLVELGMSPNSRVYEQGRLVVPCTLLEYACILEKEAAIRALINSGADLQQRTHLGEFAIETLIHKNRPDLAAMLAVKVHKRTDEATFEHIVSDYLVRSHDPSRKNHPVPPQITINGHKPSPTLEVLLNSLFPKAEKIPAGETQPKEMRFTLSFNGPFGKDFVKFKQASGGALSGGQVTTDYQLQYGYWLPGKFESMDY